MNYHKFEYLESTERRQHGSEAGSPSSACAMASLGRMKGGTAYGRCPIRVTPSALGWLLHVIVYTVEFHTPAHPRPRPPAAPTATAAAAGGTGLRRGGRGSATVTAATPASAAASAAAAVVVPAAAAVSSVVSSFFGWGGGAQATAVATPTAPESRQQQQQRETEKAVRERQLTREPAVVPIIQQIPHLGGVYIVVCHEHNKTVEPACELALSRISALLRERQEKNTRKAATLVMLREQQQQQERLKSQQRQQQQQQRQAATVPLSNDPLKGHSTTDECNSMIDSVSTTDNYPFSPNQHVHRQQQEPSHIDGEEPPMKSFTALRPSAAASLPTAAAQLSDGAAAGEEGPSPLQPAHTRRVQQSSPWPVSDRSLSASPTSQQGAVSFAGSQAGASPAHSLGLLPPLTKPSSPPYAQSNVSGGSSGTFVPPPFGLLPGELGLELSVRLLCSVQHTWRGTQQRVLAELTFPVVRTADESSVLTCVGGVCGSVGTFHSHNNSITGGSPTLPPAGRSSPHAAAAAREDNLVRGPPLVFANSPTQVQDVVRFISDSFYKAISLDTFADFTAGDLVFDVQVSERRRFAPPKIIYDAAFAQAR